ncbi:hypothetical protein CAOG_009594 [Capsaspora owczarzaki ATCC 30864]|uniref:Uncharacterized protein n=1 Tax=Capsaspora owczarzaki (strain ATCC 30864) TaxID=595528 RepID=A0A0D2WM40_CAPO3|nr:hypothetical protein CAOG_009594 [Capsaspora owczarzaki ATCC 30864]
MFLWKNMLGILGNINNIPNPAIHCTAIQGTLLVLDLLVATRDNQGISMDNQSTPPVPLELPPLFMFVGWLCQAAAMPDHFRAGRSLATGALCRLMTRRLDRPVTLDYLAHYYRLLHSGLRGNDLDVQHAIISNSTRIFTLGLPGSTMVLVDFLTAIESVLLTNRAESFALRTDALKILFSLTCLPNLYKPDDKVPDLQRMVKSHPTYAAAAPGHLDTQTQPEVSRQDQERDSEISMQQVKDRVMMLLIRVSREEPHTPTRCHAICALATFVFDELANKTNNPRLSECFDVLLALLRCDEPQVAQMAVKMLSMLSMQFASLSQMGGQLVDKVYATISATIRNLLENELPTSPMGATAATAHAEELTPVRRAQQHTHRSNRI